MISKFLEENFQTQLTAINTISKILIKHNNIKIKITLI